MAELYLKKGEGRELKKGGPWIYDNEIERVEGALNRATSWKCETLTDM